MITDTAMTAPETEATLLAQQSRLLNGMRDVQMFPVGTPELPLPVGFDRVTNNRGVFHYNPERIKPDYILTLSAFGMENEFLELGPYSKLAVMFRALNGEELTFISEYTPSGVEVRTAIGTDGTRAEQLAYFETSKQSGNVVTWGVWPQRVKEKLNGNL